MRFVGAIRNRSASKQPDPEITFTGSCPIRQHTADGHYVGRCEHATYNGYCYLHGDVREFVEERSKDALTKADDRLLLPFGERDFGPPHIRHKIGR